jgi:flagellar motor protein MotB
MESRSSERSPKTPPGDSPEGNGGEPSPATRYILSVIVILTPALVAVAVTLKTKLDRAVADANAARAELAVRAARDRAQQAQLASLRRQVDETQATVRADTEELRGLASTDKDLSAQIHSTSDVVDRLRNDLNHFVENLDCCPDGGLESAPVDAGADSRATLFEDGCATPLDAFERLARGRGLSTLRRGDQAVLQIPTAALFDASATSISTPGRAVLVRFARILVNSRWEGPLRVAAYANEPPVRGELDSSWLFTAAQAAHVVEILAAQGIPARALSATGYGASEAAADVNEYEENAHVELSMNAAARICSAAISDGGP